jgi:hypothetical protein
MHDAALKQAEAALENGTARLIDWSEAKDILRQRVRP